MADIKVKTDDPSAPKKRNSKSLENLKSFADRTPEERKLIGSAGGKARAEKMKYRASFKEAMQWALELPAMKGNPTVDKIRKQFPGINNRDAMAISMVAEAIKKGNVKAFEAVRDTNGESPHRTIDLGDEGGITINIKTVE